MQLELNGGEKMKFEDVIYATALVLFCYCMLLIPLNSFLGFNLILMPASQITAFFLSGLITGGVFAKKMMGSKRTAIVKVLLMMSVVVVFFVLSSNYIDWTGYKEIYSTTWTASQWNREMGLML
jgi:hypothetical protein